MTFWELREPPGSDYKHVQVNGKLDHPFRLPSAQCEACGETVSAFDAVLPYECPVPMRRHPLLTDPDAEIPMKQFRRRAESPRYYSLGWSERSEWRPRSPVSQNSQGLKGRNKTTASFPDVPRFQRGEDFLWAP